MSAGRKEEHADMHNNNKDKQAKKICFNQFSVSKNCYIIMVDTGYYIDLTYYDIL